MNEKDELLSRVNGLLNSDRLDYLALTPEFAQIRWELMSIQSVLLDEGNLRPGRVERIESAEEHLANINPHIQKMFIDGELKDVWVLTDPEKVAEMLRRHKTQEPPDGEYVDWD